MPRAKTPKFESFNSQLNCFDWFKGEKDYQKYLNSNGPFTLELGCGKAEPLVELSRTYPNRNFIGIDLKSDRLFRPGKIALEEKLPNIVFIRAHANQLLEIFEPGIVEELWITFPDPFPKKRQAKRRLTGGNFLKIYHKILKENGFLRFKTDNKILFDWSMQEARNFGGFSVKAMTNDLHSDNKIIDQAKIITTFEQRFISQGLKIYYLELEKLSRAH